MDCQSFFERLKDHTYKKNTNNNKLQKEALSKTIITICQGKKFPWVEIFNGLILPTKIAKASGCTILFWYFKIVVCRSKSPFWNHISFSLDEYFLEKMKSLYSGISCKINSKNIVWKRGFLNRLWSNKIMKTPHQKIVKITVAYKGIT